MHKILVMNRGNIIAKNIKIGEGGFGAVYLSKLDPTSVIKICKVDPASDTADKLLLLSEMLLSLSKENIIPQFRGIIVFDDDETNEYYGIKMKKYDSDLTSFIKKKCGNLNIYKNKIESNIIRLYDKLLRLNYLCCDIKLSNIVITENRIENKIEIRLIDLDYLFCRKIDNNKKLTSRSMQNILLLYQLILHIQTYCLCSSRNEDKFYLFDNLISDIMRPNYNFKDIKHFHLESIKMDEEYIKNVNNHINNDWDLAIFNMDELIIRLTELYTIIIDYDIKDFMHYIVGDKIFENLNSNYSKEKLFKICEDIFTNSLIFTYTIFWYLYLIYINKQYLFCALGPLKPVIIKPPIRKGKPPIQQRKQFPKQKRPHKPLDVLDSDRTNKPLDVLDSDRTNKPSDLPDTDMILTENESQLIAKKQLIEKALILAQEKKKERKEKKTLVF